MYDLGFISDENILNHVKETVRKYRQSYSMNLRDFNKNLIDPIKFTFDAKVYSKTIKDIIEAEVLRQIDKSNTNHIGYFHQNIFKHLGDGWHLPKEGYDVENLKKKIFVEIKNKHNTMNSSSSSKTYMRMLYTVMKDPEAKCFLVEAIAKKSQNICWSTTIEKKKMSDERIRRISMDKFYEMVTGDQFSFRKLCEKLPIIISDAIGEIENTGIQNTVFQELQNISPNLLKSVYLLSFKKYEGFSDLEMDDL
jgi:Eco47II restriction endonuclease